MTTAAIPSQATLSRAWYSASFADFLAASSDTVLGRLATSNDFSLEHDQRDAWLGQFKILRDALRGLTGTVFLEFNIPRMGRRIDAVLLIGPVVFVVEFKVGDSEFDRGAMDQVWDYALDLKNFHKASHVASIVPVLVATNAARVPEVSLNKDLDDVYRPVLANSVTLRPTIDFALGAISGTALNDSAWEGSPYHPTPTIVEAARSLYAQHSVEAIESFDAGRKNLRVTSKRVEALIDEARLHRRKIICFVTGVPGAGKTLVGLNVATRRRDRKDPTHAVFLSGNGPLVQVLCEALTRDEIARLKASGKKSTKGKVGKGVKAFIQNVHHFRDESLRNHESQVENVVIFDEAQRAWNLRKTANFMKRKKNLEGFTQSEPEFLISCMDRRPDWAVIVCLVGGGQEINTGEAGIGEWLNAVERAFPHWHVCISSRLFDSEYAAGDAIAKVKANGNARLDDDLHLAVAMRSFRAENVSAFVKALLDCQQREARSALEAFSTKFPIAITRDLGVAKQWIRARARGSERYGLVASSKAQRLKPHALDIRVKIDPVQWFLNDRNDTRSSYYLEDAATEFQVQGLELDWACVTWDGDMRFAQEGWSFHDFRGTRWNNIKDVDARNFTKNAYRVLLTRARQGMVIFVPAGDSNDPTRSPAIYDSTFQYLSGLGIPVLAGDVKTTT